MATIIFWSSKDIYHGITYLKALEYFRIKKLPEIVLLFRIIKKERFSIRNKVISLIAKNMVEAREPIDNLLVELFDLKQNQRKIIQNIKVGENKTIL